MDEAVAARAAGRAAGRGRTVWLASFPKSGNTWMRAIVTAMSVNEHLFAVNQLGSGAQPHYVGGMLGHLGLDVRWTSRDECARLRDHQVRAWGETPTELPEGAPDPLAPILRKTHEVYRAGSPGREPFPLAATRAAILIVRDPRDVACSYAPFFGLDLPASVDAMGREHPNGLASPAFCQTAQPWGSWSSHTRSWLADDVPFPVHLIRYEDLRADAVTVLQPVFAAIGLACTRDELAEAVRRTSFERLQASEAQRGFRETSRKTKSFFRSGRAGGWRDELPGELVAAVEADHGDTMAALGYELTSPSAQRDALAESRASRRRHERQLWTALPPWLGVSVGLGDLPEALPGAQRPRPWIQVAEDKILVRFAGGAGLLVEGGQSITVGRGAPPENPDEDASWIVQGWGVTLASLQRGYLSLHAATVRVGDRYVAIAGHRGAGKSTTSMGLRRRGHRLLVDDVTIIEFREDGAWTTPFTRNVHLLPDAAEALGVDFDALPILSGGRTKAAFRAEEPPEVPHPIDQIIVLTRDSGGSGGVEVVQNRGADRLSALIGHTRRDGIAPLVLGDARYFELLTRLAAAVPVWTLRRPTGQWTLEDVLDAVEVTAEARPGSAGQGPGVVDLRDPAPAVTQR